MTVLAISPHLDDAAFSAGGLLATLARAHRVVVATVFTQSVPAPTGFALRCQTDKGLAPEEDYLALRRAEDAAACAALGAEPAWLGLPEAPHRGYETPDALFAGVLPADAGTWEEVLRALQPLARALRPGLVLSCQGLGHHVDHLHVVRAVAAWTARVGVPALWWRDLPYAFREPGAAPAPACPGALQSHVAALDARALQAKLDACAAYQTQLPYQFGRDADEAPETAMRRRLTAFSRQEAAHKEAAPPGLRWAERFDASGPPAPPA